MKSDGILSKSFRMIYFLNTDNENEAEIIENKVEIIILVWLSPVSFSYVPTSLLQNTLFIHKKDHRIHQ